MKLKLQELNFPNSYNYAVLNIFKYESYCANLENLPSVSKNFEKEVSETKVAKNFIFLI